MKTVLVVLALIGGFLLGLPAGAGDLIVERGMLEDPGGTLSIADVEGRAFAPVGPTLSEGYSASAYWLRLRIRAPEWGRTVVLSLRPTFVNEVRLYEPDPAAPSGWRTAVTGSRHPYAGRDRAEPGLTFVVHLDGPEETCYLRLRTDTMSVLGVEALTPPEADRSRAQLDMLLVFFVTSMAYLLLWAAQSYAFSRQPAVGLFAVHQGVYILSGLAMAGYFAQFAPAGFPQLPDLAAGVLACIMNATGVLFSRALFMPYRPPRLLMRGFILVAAVIPFEILAIALGFSRFALAANTTLMMLLTWYFLLVAFAARREQTPSRAVLRSIFVAITVLTTAFWLSSFGWWTVAESNLKDMVGIVINGLISGGLLAMMLHRQQAQLRRQAEHAARELALARKTAALEHSLKEAAETQARTDFLTGLSNRRHFFDLAGQEVSRAQRYRRPLSLLMLDVDRFKAINDARGHAAGDAVLKEVSALISSHLRDADAVGRIGGEEFAAVLPETDGAQAMQVAERLCAAIAETPIAAAAGEPLRITVSIGLAEMKDRAIGFEALLQEADRALYEAKEAGRNRVTAAA